MNILLALFGQKTEVRFECSADNGVAFKGVARFETFNVSSKQLEEKIRDLMCVRTGENIVKAKIVAIA